MYHFVPQVNTELEIPFDVFHSYGRFISNSYSNVLFYHTGKLMFCLPYDLQEEWLLHIMPGTPLLMTLHAIIPQGRKWDSVHLVQTSSELLIL